MRLTSKKIEVGTRVVLTDVTREMIEDLRNFDGFNGFDWNDKPLKRKKSIKRILNSL